MKKCILWGTYILLNTFVFGHTNSWAQNRGDVKVFLSGLDHKSGDLIVILSKNDQQFSEGYPGSLKSIIRIGGVNEYQLTLKNLPYSTYAIKVILDENKNQLLDTNLIGTPIEKYGYSTNPRTIISNPRFSHCRFGLVKDKLELSIVMK